MAADKAFVEFQELSCELQRVSMAKMGAHERLAFCINLYNMMITHAFVQARTRARAHLAHACAARVRRCAWPHVRTCALGWRTLDFDLDPDRTRSVALRFVHGRSALYTLAQVGIPVTNWQRLSFFDSVQ